MFSSTSRYYALSTLTLTDAQGRTIAYHDRRLLPAAASIPTLGAVTVIAGDRVDLVATRALGDPLQYWQLCDANSAMNPFDLLGAPGTTLRVGVPGNPAAGT